MENYEQKLEEGLSKFAIDECMFHTFTLNKQAIIDFSKSPAVKEYHTRGMYSEEEVKSLIQKFNKDQCASKWYEDDEDWFEQNKKK